MPNSREKHLIDQNDKRLSGGHPGNHPFADYAAGYLATLPGEGQPRPMRQRLGGKLARVAALGANRYGEPYEPKSPEQG